MNQIDIIQPTKIQKNIELMELKEEINSINKVVYRLNNEHIELTESSYKFYKNLEHLLSKCITQGWNLLKQSQFYNDLGDFALFLKDSDEFQNKHRKKNTSSST